MNAWDFDFDSVLKLYRGTDCEDNGTDDLVDCFDDAAWSIESFVWTADADGWYTIVADGGNSFVEDDDYWLYITLTCLQADCCCP
jgi:hypothetical protein